MLKGDKPPTTAGWIQACLEAKDCILIDGFVPEIQPQWPYVVFCTTCLNRAEQLLVSLPCNLLYFWGLQQRGGWCITTFGDDVDLVRRIANAGQRAVEVGLLHVASGGAAADVFPHAGEAAPPAGGSASSSAGEVATPARGSSSSGEAAPPATAGSSATGNSKLLPRLKHWRSSFAKNTAHMFAIDKFGSQTNLENLVLVNLDCDNITSNDFAEAVMKSFAELSDPSFACLSTEDCASALTGRLCYRASDFLVLGGYDQLAGPTGHQDTDLRERFTRTRKRNHSLPPPTRLKGHNLCGGALPNDPTSWKRDRNEAKIANVDPDVRGSRSWSEMQKETKDALTEKTKRGEYVRNANVSRLGSFFVELDLRRKAGDEAAPTPAAAPAEAVPVGPLGAKAKAPPSSRASGSGGEAAAPKPPTATVRSASANKMPKAPAGSQQRPPPTAQAASSASQGEPPTRTLGLDPLPRRKYVNPLVELKLKGVRPNPYYVDMVALGLRLLCQERSTVAACRPQRQRAQNRPQRVALKGRRRRRRMHAGSELHMGLENATKNTKQRARADWNTGMNACVGNQGEPSTT